MVRVAPAPASVAPSIYSAASVASHALTEEDEEEDGEEGSDEGLDEGREGREGEEAGDDEDEDEDGGDEDDEDSDEDSDGDEEDDEDDEEDSAAAAKLVRQQGHGLAYDRAAVEGAQKVRRHVKKVVRVLCEVEANAAVHNVVRRRTPDEEAADAAAKLAAAKAEAKLAAKAPSAAEALREARAAAKKSQAEARLHEAKAIFAHVSHRESVLVEVNDKLSQAEEDLRALQAAEERQRQYLEHKKKLRDEESLVALYDTQVLEAQLIQKDELELARAANPFYCLPASSKAAMLWREAIKMSADEMAARAVEREKRRGSAFFDFPTTDVDVATCTVAFLNLPKSQASVTGFLPWVQVGPEMADLISHIRQRLLRDTFAHEAAVVAPEDLYNELSRQGATLRMLRKDGVSFSRFSSVLVAFTRVPPLGRGGASLLHRVPQHPDVNRVMPRFTDYAPVAQTWLPEFRAGLVKYTAATPRFDYLGLCELEPVKAVEVMELLKLQRGRQFAKGAIEAVQLDVSRLHSGRLLNAAEFNICCIRSSSEEIRNDPKNRAYLKWLTDPLLLDDPLRPHVSRCAVA